MRPRQRTVRLRRLAESNNPQGVRNLGAQRSRGMAAGQGKILVGWSPPAGGAEPRCQVSRNGEGAMMIWRIHPKGMEWLVRPQPRHGIAAPAAMMHVSLAKDRAAFRTAARRGKRYDRLGSGAALGFRECRTASGRLNPIRPAALPVPVEGSRVFLDKLMSKAPRNVRAWWSARLEATRRNPRQRPSPAWAETAAVGRRLRRATRGRA
jgi:hypothetical protein